MYYCLSNFPTTTDVTDGFFFSFGLVKTRYTRDGIDDKFRGINKIRIYNVEVSRMSADSGKSGFFDPVAFIYAKPSGPPLSRHRRNRVYARARAPTDPFAIDSAKWTVGIQSPGF